MDNPVSDPEIAAQKFAPFASDYIPRAQSHASLRQLACCLKIMDLTGIGKSSAKGP
jgi:hypothetical protein